MEILKIVITIIFVIDCIALSAVVLMQEGKSAGLGTIAGMADTYWGQNRGRSMEGTLVKVTKILAALKYGRHLFHLHRDIEFVTDELVYHFLSFLILSVHCPHLACSLLFYTHIVKSPEVSKDIFRDRKR